MINFDLVVVGTSLGGLYALKTLLAGLPQSFPLPMAIVQHRSRDGGSHLGLLLQEVCRLSILEAEDKAPIIPGQVYLAPADYHLLVERGHFALSTEAPVSYSRPSIDVLFESAALAYQERLIGVVLTGANQDGACGAVEIKKRGGWVIVQEPATAESAIMPRAAIAATNVDKVLRLEEIPACLVNLCKVTTASCEREN